MRRQHLFASATLVRTTALGGCFHFWGGERYPIFAAKVTEVDILRSPLQGVLFTGLGSKTSAEVSEGFYDAARMGNSEVPAYVQCWDSVRSTSWAIGARAASLCQ